MKNYNKDQHQQKPGGVVNIIKDLLVAGSGTQANTGLKWGVGNVLTRTVLKRLPTPLNFVVPIIAEKLINKDTVDTGRDVLIKGLKWVKKVTDEKPVTTLQEYR